MKQKFFALLDILLLSLALLLLEGIKVVFKLRRGVNIMAISMQELNAERADLRIELRGGGDLNIVYSPQAYTAEVEEVFQSVAEGNRPAASLSRLLAAMLIEWDLTETKGGAKLPVTVEILDRLGIKVLNALVFGIMEDMKPGEK